MTVASFHLPGQKVAEKNDTESSPQFFNKKCEINSQWKDLIKEAILCNTDVRIEVNDAECKYEPCGSSLEVGMIKFLIENEEDVQMKFISRNKYQRKLGQLPFDQNLKRKVVVRSIKGNDELVRVYVKGAPEYIVDLCTHTLNHDLSKHRELDHEEKELMLTNIISLQMAQEGLKVLTYAFKDMHKEDFDHVKDYPESAEFR
jgi:magnesium-transporting ATPase (P-type)